MAERNPGSFQPGHPKVGGRVAGVRNKATREREQRLVQMLIADTLTPEQRAALTPLDVMLRIMKARDAAGDEAGALQAAALCAPYLHARLSSADLKVTSSVSVASDAELAEAIAEIEAKRAAAGLLN